MSRSNCSMNYTVFQIANLSLLKISLKSRKYKLLTAKRDNVKVYVYWLLDFKIKVYRYLVHFLPFLSVWQGYVNISLPVNLPTNLFIIWCIFPQSGIFDVNLQLCFKDTLPEVWCTQRLSRHQQTVHGISQIVYPLLSKEYVYLRTWIQPWNKNVHHIYIYIFEKWNFLTPSGLELGPPRSFSQ
jgi:hypothetical protein